MAVQLVDLRRAVDGDQLIPYFQPIVELRTGELACFEVLARWQHPVKGPCLPANFISLAEENGLIGRVSDQVFRKAFRAAMTVPAPVTLSVNISPVQLRHSSLPKEIKSAADDAGFPLDRLIVEITETALTEDLKRAQKIARELKAMGCTLTLDDFGTGYSSLGSLQALPFDELKIDRSFVASMTEKRESRKIVAAIAGLGCSLGILTVAEGVETEEQAEMLLLFGCSRAQGWLFGRPVPGSEIASLVAAPPWVAPRLDPASAGRWEDSSLEALPVQRLSQLQAIYDGAPVGLGFLDCDLRYVNLNRRLAEMNGLPVSRHLGKSVEEALPAVFPKVQGYLLRALEGEAISGVEIVRPASAGMGPEWTSLVSYHPARDEAGEVIGISVAVVDVSELKKSREALEESVFLYRHMAGICRQLPWTMDGEGKDLHVGSQPVAVAGSDEDAAQHPEWLGTIHPADRELTIDAMRTGMRSKQPIDVEYRVMSPQRCWRWMRLRASPRLGPDGAVLRWYGGVEDVEDQKRMEQELRESRAAVAAMSEGAPVLVIQGERPEERKPAAAVRKRRKAVGSGG